uniref:Putative secreted protein n=1 Tax=Anopheles darlingi TaxID=43151 RepID=A0A2M4D7F6_ANODA
MPPFHIVVCGVVVVIIPRDTSSNNGEGVPWEGGGKPTQPSPWTFCGTRNTETIHRTFHHHHHHDQWLAGSRCPLCLSVSGHCHNRFASLSLARCSSMVVANCNTNNGVDTNGHKQKHHHPRAHVSPTK